ncbi:glycosyltransferase family 4 protein, partial [Helicobacter rodentium]|uniref:glycosyltransferase family 4 protein n=1 Tax=Helicobacter rodentium TaxID=59617 RepID=UPI0026189086
MKILFLSHTDSNLYLFRLPIMLALQAQGHEVIALTPKGADFDKFAPLGIQAIDYSINRGSLNPLSAFKTIQEITKILQNIKPDIVHTFMLKPNIYGSFAAKIAGLDCVINSLTGLGSFYIDESLKSRALRFIIESLNRLAFKIAQKVLFQNNDDLELYVQKGILKREKAILIKGSGIDTQTFAPINQESYNAMRQKLSAELNLPLMSGSILVLMVARAIAHKGVREYYEAAEILKGKNCVFLYVGGVDLGNISSMNEVFLKSSAEVIYLGQRKDIRSLMGACDLFVLPSYREGIPRTLLEAGSMAKPIITTDAVGCREVVENGKNGFLVPIGDSKQLAEKILQLSKDKDLREKFGKVSREKICAEFSTDSIVQSYLSLYDSVLSSKQEKSTSRKIYPNFIKPVLDFSFSFILLLLF